MLNNNFDLIELNETNKNSKGGTELVQRRLYDGSVSRELLEQFQIIFSRARDLDDTKFRIFYCHDLPGDPESNILTNGGWNKFHKIVFVSNWQMQAYIEHYSIPWSHCEVIENSILPISIDNKTKDDTIRLCYTSTPHRGLNIVYAAFDELTKKHDNIELDVFSSFNLYGWDERDKEYQEIFDALKNHSKVNYHGTKSNDEIREYLATKGNIFVHPSTWPETSCLCLIEAMSAGLMCIHSNYAALPDTSGGMTHMYQFDSNENNHATKLYHILDGSINNFKTDYTSNKLLLAKVYADSRFNWNVKASHWNALLQNIIYNNPDRSVREVLQYNG